VFRGIFVPQTDEVREDLTLHKNEFHSLFSPVYIFRLIKLRSMRWMGNKKCLQNFLVVNLQKKRLFETLSIIGRI
jgi:hypothetical protein